jgi:hypothetical protein
MPPVQSPESVRNAMVFLASRIAEEAEREGLPLTETERKMLYFSETGWTLPDMPEVNDAFERECDRKQYERRVARLIRGVRARAHARLASDREREGWNQSLDALRGSDCYLVTLIAAAKPKGEITRLVITAVVVLAVMMLAVYLAGRAY